MPEGPHRRSLGSLGARAALARGRRPARLGPRGRDRSLATPVIQL